MAPSEREREGASFFENEKMIWTYFLTTKSMVIEL